MSCCMRTDVSHRAHALTMYLLCPVLATFEQLFQLYEQQNPKGAAGYRAQYSLTLRITNTAGRWSNDCAIKVSWC